MKRCKEEILYFFASNALTTLVEVALVALILTEINDNVKDAEV